MLGREFVLHKIDFPGMTHGMADEFVRVKIIEVKPVKGNYGGEGEGGAAQGEGGSMVLST